MTVNYEIRATLPNGGPTTFTIRTDHLFTQFARVILDLGVWMVEDEEVVLELFRDGERLGSRTTIKGNEWFDVGKLMEDNYERD